MRWFVLAAALVGLAAAPAFAESWGLLDQPQTFPWTLGLAPVAQEEAGGLDAGRARVRTAVLWFNTDRQLGVYLDLAQKVDFEALLSTTTAAWSPAPGWELRAQVQAWAQGGGMMDAGLSAFHHLFGLPNQGRDYTDDNQFRDFLLGSFDDRAPGSGPTQASVGLRAFSGPWAATAWAKLPVAGHVGWGWSDVAGAGASLSWGGSLASAGAWGASGGASAALVWAGWDAHLPGQSSPWTGQGDVFVAIATPWALRLLAQGSYTASPRTGEGYLPQGAGLLTLGGQVPLDRSWLLEAAVTEEFLTWATMEVGFQLGVAWLP